MSTRLFTKDHEWLSVDGEVVTVGITEHAADQLGDVVYVELPEPGAEVSAGEEVVEIESVKATSDIKAPMEGTVVKVNEGLSDAPEVVNEDPLGEGWIFKLKVDGEPAPDAFFSAEAYQDYCGA